MLCQMTVSIGDTVVELPSLLHVLGTRQPTRKRELRARIEIGDGRAFEEDPKDAIRFLDDIASKASSPATNDPTTAVQDRQQSWRALPLFEWESLSVCRDISLLYCRRAIEMVSQVEIVQ